MFKNSISPSFAKGINKRQESAASITTDAAKRVGRLSAATKDTSKGDNIVSRLQKFGQEENERKKKAVATKQSTVSPEKGFVQRMVDKYWHGKKE